MATIRFLNSISYRKFVCSSPSTNWVLNLNESGSTRTQVGPINVPKIIRSQKIWWTFGVGQLVESEINRKISYDFWIFGVILRIFRFGWMNITKIRFSLFWPTIMSKCMTETPSIFDIKLDQANGTPQNGLIIAKIPTLLGGFLAPRLMSMN